MSPKYWLYSLGFVLVAAAELYLMAPQEVLAAYTMNCSSNDGGRRFCPANTGRGVRLIRQISQSPCIQGRTWGWDRGGVWVDRGCRADFEIRGGPSGPPPGMAPPGPRPPIIVSCSSDDMRRHFCGIPVRRTGVRLVGQRSQSPCRRGYSWGTTRNSIWVDRGCRADFEVR